MSDAAEAGDKLRDQLDRSLSGTFQIVRELGGGGMARVFLAEESALGRRVVVKVLLPELAHALSAERFAREIRLSARLQHPNIVPVLTADAAADVPYYTMPYIEGESLRARLARLAPGERLPLAQALALLRDIARALAYAHERGVIHRDIKPDNVLLGSDAAMVADFGIAKAVAAARTQAAGPAFTLTQDGAALGTPAYMSPEQAAGDPAVDHRADVYAWGVLAYELLAGVHPFAGRDSAQAMFAAHLVDQPPPLPRDADVIPPLLGDLVTRCLAKNRDDRPSTARELVAALSAIESRGTDSGAAAAPSPHRRGVRVRHVALAGTIVLVLAGAAAASGVLARRPAARPDVAARAWVHSAGYDAYLRGRVRVSSENRQDNEAAIAALRQAIAADPGLAPALAELGRAYAINAFYFASGAEQRRLLEEAEVAIEKALALDDRLASAHFARGLLLWSPARRFPHEQAIQAYRRALALDSTLDEAHHQLALVLMHVGLLDDAQAEFEHALALDPTNTLARFRLGVIDLYRGEYEQALAIFNSTPLDRSPALWAFQTATALLALGRDTEAANLIERYLRDYPGDDGGVGHSVRAMLLAKQSRRRQAQAAIDTAIALGRGFGHFHHTAYNIATAYAMLGDRDPAIRWLQEAADDGFPCYPLFASDRLLDGLRADRRFITFLDQMRRDWQQRQRQLR